MDRFDEMELFLDIARRGSLSAVARARGVAPSTVTLGLQRMEARLGVRLLARSTRRLSLTPEGEGYRADCQRILTDLAESEAGVGGREGPLTGLLRVTATNDFGRARVAPLVDAFLRLHPGVRVELVLSDGVLDLIEEGIDVALRFGPLADSRLTARRIVSGRRVVCAAPAYWARHPPPRKPADLTRHNCLVLARPGAPQTSWAFRDEDGRVFHVRVSGDRTANDGGVLKDWALAGAGVILKSTWDVEALLASGHLVSALDRFTLPDIDLHAVHTAGREPGRRLAAFLAFLDEHLHLPPGSVGARRRRASRKSSSLGV
ncbi:LysR family transcriptional regulator [Corallococcus exiguus]|uniref:LysR family transcriptional regulator n=1 Tax=Corallococcus exiguus TaxID=83462 RepID=UPI0014947255|nr:LysR family transcriptional regulator [Corallococcus exiguus]NPD23659.1 LysR family transcriptional regulator [Corallococcus exiguus]